MKKFNQSWFYGLMFANLLAFQPGGAIAAGDCACDEACQQKCAEGKGDSCTCKECDCAKGHCKHGKCAHHPKETKE